MNNLRIFFGFYLQLVTITYLFTRPYRQDLNLKLLIRLNIFLAFLSLLYVFSISFFDEQYIILGFFVLYNFLAFVGYFFIIPNYFKFKFFYLEFIILFRIFIQLVVAFYNCYSHCDLKGGYLYYFDNILLITVLTIVLLPIMIRLCDKLIDLLVLAPKKVLKPYFFVIPVCSITFLGLVYIYIFFHKFLINYFVFISLFFVLYSLCYYLIIYNIIEKSTNAFIFNFQNEILKSKMENLEQQNIQTRMLKHDIKNHLNILSIMLDKKKYDDMANYLKQLVGEVKKIDVNIFSRNPYINGIINYVIDKRNNPNVEVCADIEIDSYEPLNDLEFINIIMNILNNAFDAYEDGKNKEKIEISIKKQNDYLIIQCTNAIYKKIIKDEDGKIKTTKQNLDNEHGHGLAIVERIVKEHDGRFLIKHDKIFMLTVMVKVKKDV